VSVVNWKEMRWFFPEGGWYRMLWVGFSGHHVGIVESIRKSWKG
jgi:hypothetical protein